MAKFEDYRQPWETGPHWELKKEFIDAYQDMFEEDRLLCLAQAYANVVLMNCCYPGPVMHQIAELSKPLKLRKKFQNVSSNSEADTSNKEQSRVSEKIKSIYGQTGRPFKQVKFCSSKEEYNSEFSSDFANLSQSSSENLQNSTPLSVSSQQDTQPLLQTNPSLNVLIKESLPSPSNELMVPKSETPSFDANATKQPQPIPHIKSDFSPEEEKIISALGLSYIQSVVEMMRKYTPKIDHPVGVIHCIIEKLGLEKDHSFEVMDDPASSPKDGKMYVAKLCIKNCEIASGSSRNKKNAKKLAAETAINTLYKLSLSKTSTKLENLSEYEIQNTELKQDSSYSNNIEKPPFILNEKKYHLSVRDGFVLVEKQNKVGLLKNEKTLVYESASFNHKTYQFEFEDVPEITPPSKKAILLIGGAVVGTGVGVTKEEAKAAACTEALQDMKKKYYTLRIKDEYVEGFIINRSQVFDGESFSSNVISESNIGCKMLKNMGWSGGGLGGKGIAEPIQATANLSFGSGLGFEESKAPQDSKLFRKRLEAMLRDFCKSENYSDLVFSKDFTKDERKEIHQLAGRLHLHTQSRGVGDDRFLTIRQKYETTKLLKFLVKNGGSNSKFELIDSSGTQI